MKKSISSFLAILLVLTIIMPTLALAKEHNTIDYNNINSFSSNYDAERLIQQSIDQIDNLTLPNPDVKPDPKNRIEYAKIELKAAIDGTFNLNNNVNSSKFFEHSLNALKRLNFFINYPHSTDEYKEQIAKVSENIYLANKIVIEKSLSLVELDIDKYPQKYKHLLKNAKSKLT